MPISNELAQSLVGGFSTWKQQQNNPLTIPETVQPEKSWGERAKDDIVNTVSNYLEGAKQGWNEQYRQEKNIRDIAYVDEFGNASPKNGYTQEEVNAQKALTSQAQANFARETALPTLAFTGYGTVPAVGAMLSDAAINTYQNTEGSMLDKTGNAVRSVTYGPAVDMATDPELGQRFYNRPISTIAEGAMAVGQAILPFAGARRGFQKAADIKSDIVARVENKLNEITDNAPLQNIGIQGLDALDQFDSPTRGFRPAAEAEMKQWNIDQNYGPVFEQIGRAHV